MLVWLFSLMGALLLDDDVVCRWTRKKFWPTEMTITSANSRIVSLSAAAKAECNYHKENFLKL